MIAKILSFIKSNQLINPNEKIIAAVSGGVDSMVMFYCLHAIKDDLQFSLEVCHVNHGIRGDESDKDELLVKVTAEKLKLPFQSEKLEGFNLRSSEEELREARYSAFKRFIGERIDAKIATAHNLNDQFETFLMRLAKGSKLNGLCSIPARRGDYIRPMLGIKKSELMTYAEDNDIIYREDSSNRDTYKTRNKIRHEITPQLINVFGKDFLEGFYSSIEDLNLVNNLIKNQVNTIFQRISRVSKDGLIIDKDRYLSLDRKIRHLILESCVSGHYHLNFGIPSGYFSEFESFVNEAANSSVFHFRNGLEAVKLRKYLLFTNSDQVHQQKLELYPGDVVYTGKYEVRATELNTDLPDFSRESRMEIVCGDKIKWPLTIRFWTEGDWFFPLGSNHRQKLSDFFINQKIEVYEKSQIPIITDGENIVWIAGQRLDDRYKITNECRKKFRLELRTKEES